METEMKELLEGMIKAIVDKPDEVNIDLTESENTLIYELKVGEGDIGKVIGKKGKNVGSLRTLLSAATANLVTSDEPDLVHVYPPPLILMPPSIGLFLTV